MGSKESQTQRCPNCGKVEKYSHAMARFTCCGLPAELARDGRLIARFRKIKLRQKHSKSETKRILASRHPGTYDKKRKRHGRAA